MAKKKKNAEKPTREFTRRQLSQWQRQKKRQRVIMFGGIFVIAAIILIVLVGWYLGEYRPLHRTFIRVNDTEFNMGYYIDTLKLVGEGQTPQYISGVADRAVVEIEQNELIRQGALRLGISVSDDEVKEIMKNSGVDINDASVDFVRVQILRSRLYDEYLRPQVPESAPQVNIMAMLLDGEGQAAGIRDRLQNSENFTALAEEFSLDDYSRTNKGEIGWHSENILADLLGSSVPGEYAFGSEAGVLSQPRYDGEKQKGLGYWLVKIRERENIPDVEYAQVQALLLSSEEEANDVRARLEAGEDLATLAEDLSQFEESKKQGGELGVVDRGEMSPPVDDFIFNLNVAVGIWSEPIRDETVETTGGYWLVKVLDKDDDRRLSSEDRDYLVSRAFGEWVSSLWLDPTNEVDASNLSGEIKQLAVARATKG